MQSDDTPEEQANEDTSIPNSRESYGQEPDKKPAGQQLNNPELDESFIDIADVITCLYELSVTIRNPAPQDKLEKCQHIDMSVYEFYDMQHVENKYHGAEKYLIDRLGRANTRRRQLLKYHQLHYEKIARRYPNTTEDEKALDASPTIAPTMKTHATVSKVEQREVEAFDICSDTNHSHISYASTASGSRNTPRVPPPPNQKSTYEGTSFLCLYCHKSLKSTVGNPGCMF